MGLSVPEYIEKKDKKVYEFKQGNWDINEPIKIKGKLIINKNTNLYFGENAYLIVNGSLVINGDELNPNLITTQDSNKFWLTNYNEF